MKKEDSLKGQPNVPWSVEPLCYKTRRAPGTGVTVQVMKALLINLDIKWR